MHVECKVDGGLLLSDPEVAEGMDETLLYELSVVLDPLGESETVHDFAEQDWQEVWHARAEKMRRLSNEGQFALLILFAGCFDVSVIQTQEGDQGALQDSFRGLGSSFLRCPSGQACLFELGAFIESKYGDMPVNPVWSGTVSACQIATFSTATGKGADGIDAGILLQLRPSEGERPPALRRIPVLPQVRRGQA